MTDTFLIEGWTGCLKKPLNGSRKWLLSGLLLALANSVWAADDPPVYGAVNAAEGQTIIERNCQSCHLRGVASAPRTGVKDDWVERLAERDLEQIIENAYTGMGRMPPRGFCRDCTRDQIGAAVVLMLPVELRKQSVDNSED